MPTKTADAFERAARNAERRNRGWIYAGDVPHCSVTINGVKTKKVRAIHRRKGKAVVMVTDAGGQLVLHKHKKRFLTKTIYGAVQLETLDCGL